MEDLELVWSHEYEDMVYGIAVYEEKLAVGAFRATYIHHLSDGLTVAWPFHLMAFI